MQHRTNVLFLTNRKLKGTVMRSPVGMQYSVSQVFSMEELHCSGLKTLTSSQETQQNRKHISLCCVFWKCLLCFWFSEMLCP